MDLAAPIQSYIARGYLDGTPDVRLDLDTPLLDLNIIDSFAMFDLVDFLHREFGLCVPLEAIVPANFCNVRSILRLLETLRR